MKKYLLLLLVALGLIATESMAIRPPRAYLQYYGHSCFLLTTAGGTRTVIDPHDKLGYPLPDEPADIVVITHEHFDHNNAKAIKGSPVVIRGLKEDGSFNPIDRMIKGVRIRNVSSYHDDEKGAKRGLNSIFIFEFSDLRLVHLGDLGHLLDGRTVEEIGRPDFLLVPVGGFFTINAGQAWEVAGQLNAKAVVPMHYQTAVTKNMPIQPVDAFLSGAEHVRRIQSTTVGLEPPDRQEAWLLQIP